VNFAHGEFYMLAAFLLFQLAGVMGVSYFLALPLAVLAVGILGVAVQRTLIRRLQGRSRLSYLYATSIATIGLSITLQNTAQLAWGAVPKSIPQPFPVQPILLGDIALSPIRLFILGASVVVIARGRSTSEKAATTSARSWCCSPSRAPIRSTSRRARGSSSARACWARPSSSARR